MTKQAHGYNLRFTVTVKHGLVKFNPLSVSFGKIVHKHFYQKGGKDVWTYDVHFSSLKKFQTRATGKIRLSVPIANIHNRVFKIVFVWGAKVAGKSNVVASALAGSSDDSSNGVSSGTSNSVSGTSSSENSSSEIPKSTSKIASNSTNTSNVTPKELSKYRVSPKKEKLADIALVNYPFLPVILSFFTIGAIVIGGAIYLRKRLLKGGNYVKK